MMTRLLTCCLLLSCMAASAQKGDTVRKYLDAKFKMTDKDKMVYAGFAIKENDQWYLTVDYPADSGTLFKIYFKDKALTIHDGPHTIYYKHNIKSEEINFRNNIAEGMYREWHENGNLKDSGNYVNGHKDGPWKSWYSNGNLESSGIFLQDKNEGEWNWYYENGKQSTKETYTRGKISKLECYDENGVYSSDRCSISKPPTALGNFTTLETYLQDNITWNKDMQNNNLTTGTWTVVVKFTITKEGKMINFNVLQSPNQAFSNEAERLLKLVQKWSPAVSHNRVQDYTMQYQVPFTKDEY